MTQLHVSIRDRWLLRGLAMACLASCGTSSTGAGPVELDAQVIDAGADDVTDAGGPKDAGANEREAPPTIVPLALVPDSPLVYQSTTEVSLPDAELGRPYVQTIHVRAGTGVAPYHLSFSGLPATAFAAVVEHNDTADADVIVLGLGADLGVSHLRVDLVDGSGVKLSTSFAFRVVEATATILPPVELPHPRAGVMGYETSFQATGGTPPLVWSASGLPVGMTIDPATGVLGGVPDATSGDHDVQLGVTVTDSLKDAATNVPGRAVTAMVQMHVDPGYRVNIYALLTSSICNFCHGDVGNSLYYKPRIAGIPTPPAGSENASGLVGEHPGGIAGDAHPTVCLPTMTYVIPGDPDNSLLFQKISGTIAAPPPCGSCMPYQGSCSNEPSVSAAGRDLVRHWIMSLPPTPSAKDLE